MPPFLLTFPTAYTVITEANILNGLHARFYNKHIPGRVGAILNTEQLLDETVHFLCWDNGDF